MNHPRIDLVVGTRPEAIKLAPIAFALAARGCSPRLLLTGQHKLDMADHGLSDFAAVELGCPGQRNPMAHADAVAHVEAGLRSFDPAMPWPEEQNRITIDRLSSLLFAPTATSAANLRAETVQGAVSVTGNTGIDALFFMLDRLEPMVDEPRGETMRLLVTCQRRENWGQPMRAVAAALNHLAAREAVEIRLVLHPNPAVAETMTKAILPCAAIELVVPLGHAEMIDAMRWADLLLSDSGGVQEEAPALGVPLLVLRDKTERPEGIASGNMLLAGTGRDKVIALVMRLIDPEVRATMSRVSLPFGDGHAGPRIADAMLDSIAAQSGGRRAAGGAG